MNEFTGPTPTGIDQRYKKIVRDPEQRAAALELALRATVPLWEMGGVDVEAQLIKQKGVHDEIVYAYTKAREEGDAAVAATHESHLAYILKIADDNYGDGVDIIEEVSASQETPQRILAYSADD